MEAVGRLAGGIAHDFNNLLTAILGYADLLLGTRTETSRADDSKRSSRRPSGRRELTRQLLAFSRQQVLEPRTLDLNEIILGIEKTLLRVTQEALEQGIAQVRVGGRISDIGHAIQRTSRSTGFRWCASSSGTASARRCTRSRRLPTTASRAAGRGWPRG